MKKLFSLFVLSLAIIIPSYAQEAKKEMRNFDCNTITSINASSSINVKYIQGSDKSNYKIMAPTRIIDMIDATVENGILKLGYKPGEKTVKLKDYEKVTVLVTSPSLSSVNISGAGTFYTLMIMQTKDHIDFTCTGASKVTVGQIFVSSINLNCTGASIMNLDKVHTESLSLTLSGASNCKLKGIADTIDYNVSGASSLKAGNLDVKIGKVNCSGMSDAVVNIKKPAKLKKSGMSEIKNIYRK